MYVVPKTFSSYWKTIFFIWILWFTQGKMEFL